jgi:hypothetical protein
MKTWTALILLIGLLGACSTTPAETTTFLTVITPSPAEDLYFDVRQQLVDEIKASGVEDPEILQIMASVPRHEFVPTKYLDQAYDDHPLPIGYGQTISQPYIVAWMTELLELQPGEKVLEWYRLRVSGSRAGGAG